MNKRFILQTLLLAATLSGLLLITGVLLWPAPAVAAAQATPVPGTPIADPTFTPSTAPTHTSPLTPTLAVSGTATIDYTPTFTPTPTSTLTPTATLTPTFTPTPTPTATPSLKIDRDSSMVVDVNGNGQIDSGDTLRHTIRVTNQGDVPASEIKLEENYDQNRIEKIDIIGGEAERTGNTISWGFNLAPGAVFKVSYDATLKSDLPSGKINVRHEAKVSSDGSVLVTADPESFFVDVLPSPTMTPTLTLTPTLTPMPTLAPTPTRESQSTFSDEPWLPSILIALISLITIAAVVYVGTHQDIKPHQIGLVREGIFLIFIVTAVLILAIDRGVPADGAISLLSAIAGYVFGRAWSATATGE